MQLFNFAAMPAQKRRALMIQVLTIVSIVLLIVCLFMSGFFVGRGSALGFAVFAFLSAFAFVGVGIGSTKV